MNLLYSIDKLLINEMSEIRNDPNTYRNNS